MVNVCKLCHTWILVSDTHVFQPQNSMKLVQISATSGLGGAEHKNWAKLWVENGLVRDAWSLLTIVTNMCFFFLRVYFELFWHILILLVNMFCLFRCGHTYVLIHIYTNRFVYKYMYMYAFFAYNKHTCFFLLTSLMFTPTFGGENDFSKPQTDSSLTSMAWSKYMANRLTVPKS